MRRQLEKVQMLIVVAMELMVGTMKAMRDRVKEIMTEVQREERNYTGCGDPSHNNVQITWKQEYSLLKKEAANRGISVFLQTREQLCEKIRNDESMRKEALRRNIIITNLTANQVKEKVFAAIDKEYLRKK